MIELGHTFYDEDWSLIGATSRSAYSPYGNAPHPSAPLAPLGNGRFRDVIDRSTLSRIVNAFVHAYDRLDLGGLSWAYWHACVAPVHSAPAQFGAAIEALQRVYIKSNPASVKSTILSRAEWKDLRANMEGELNKLGIHEDSRAALIERLNEINRAPQRAILKAVMRAIGLELGSAEDAAWARRNRAAHGMPIPEDDVLAAIRDTKLLKVLFHRLLLSCADASDAYIDYVSLDHPYRRLQEPVPDAHG